MGNKHGKKNAKAVEKKNGTAPVEDKKEEEDRAARWRAETQTKNVEEQLLLDQIASLYTFKILLLGAGESGKSTILKQVKSIHNHKLKKSELDHIATSLHQNTVDCMKALLGAMATYSISLTDEKMLDTKKWVEEFADDQKLTLAQALEINTLWKSEPIKAVYEKREDFWLLDSCDYYMENIQRFAEEDFVPNEEDSVRARIRTTGIIETDLKTRYDRKENEPEKLNVKMVDVGGQRNERKKWMHCFDDVKCILFLASMAGYKQVLFEDAKKNRVEEALELFKKTTHNSIFKDTPIFLFLNKKDLFEQMIRKHPLDECNTFKDYKGDSTYNEAFSHLKMRFREQMPPGKEVEIFDVTGVSRRDIKEAFVEVMKKLMEINRPKIIKKRAEIDKQLKKLDRKHRCIIV